ncbi:class I SAM-dependent methyltransferase [Prauserella cavernicola]|uniref:Methyltransferase domain-containing protein n=1 Tax=Prauserella cavernicola TaxID=2800127 RepID=A0A934V6Y4_9PSEU|nr:methyltransferase domain-containing protein [Prauserella cavernicola]MBK1787164.1 methyltransferase domain-containing protein [Prauserella cavernicola]
MSGQFDTGLLGNRCWLELADGQRLELPVQRWRLPPGAGDGLLLERCMGPTLDVGCGPGRLAAALVARGVATLGIDSSPVAVRLATERGAVALRRDVFDPVPGEGRWRHVLLADGNIGIGGDPVRLLRRARRLLQTGGSVLVELEPPGRGLRRERVRVSGTSATGSWFGWAWLGMDALGASAEEAGFTVHWSGAHGQRWFAELRG